MAKPRETVITIETIRRTVVRRRLKTTTGLASTTPEGQLPLRLESLIETPAEKEQKKIKNDKE